MEVEWWGGSQARLLPSTTRRAHPADYKSALPSVLFEEVVDAFFVVAVEVAGEGGLISYELALAER